MGSNIGRYQYSTVQYSPGIVTYGTETDILIHKKNMTTNIFKIFIAVTDTGTRLDSKSDHDRPAEF
jgi:hypothetical protein